MRRMYSKEQLNKLIEEVSKLIAIEELDKVVPVPSVEKAGYFMRVNNAGTGYELVQTSDSSLYYHPIYFYFYNEGTLAVLTCIILDNVSTAYTTSTLMPKLKALMDLGALINVNGCARANASANYATAVDIVKKEGHYIIEGFDSSSWRTPILDLTELTPAAVSDGVNQLL